MKKLDVEIDKNKQEVINIVKSLIDKGANYAIKSMPINSHIKEILKDVKEVINEQDFSEILKVALSSSIYEGLNIIGVKNVDLNQIRHLVETAYKGGFPYAINAGIDIVSVTKKYGNLFGNYIEEFLTKLKAYILSTEFKKKLDNSIERCLDKVDNFKELCNDWYDAYDSFNIEDIKNIANKLNKMKYKVSFNTDCINENTIIQNMTEFVDRKKKPLTKIQYDIYSNLY